MLVRFERCCQTLLHVKQSSNYLIGWTCFIVRNLTFHATWYHVRRAHEIIQLSFHFLRCAYSSSSRFCCIWCLNIGTNIVFASELNLKSQFRAEHQVQAELIRLIWFYRFGLCIAIFAIASWRIDLTALFPHLTNSIRCQWIDFIHFVFFRTVAVYFFLRVCFLLT